MSYSAFTQFKCVASGSLADVFPQAIAGATVFDLETGRVVDVDPRFPPQDDTPKPGRPKLGVTAREVTLLPRHWDWLATQPGGASVALRKLVEDAMRHPNARKRQLQDAAYRFATALVGDAPGYEDAMRALYAANREDFAFYIDAWPNDVRRVLTEITADVW